jgi:hypothetical protein
VEEAGRLRVSRTVEWLPEAATITVTTTERANVKETNWSFRETIDSDSFRSAGAEPYHRILEAVKEPPCPPLRAI